MTWNIIALLDRPTSSAFGIAPFVVQDEHGILHVHGLRNRPRSALDPAELDQLVRSKSALRLPRPVPLEEDRRDVVAGWLGRDFRRQVARLRAPEPRVPPLFEIEPDGGFWIDAPSSVYGLLEQWIREAAAEVFAESGSAELAELMIWVLPERDETRAAVWYTRRPDSEKARHLEWYARLERDAGRPISPEELEEHFRQVARVFQRPIEARMNELRKPLKRATEAPWIGVRRNAKHAA